MENGLDVHLFKKASVMKMDKHVLSRVQSKKLLLESGKKHFNLKFVIKEPEQHVNNTHKIVQEEVDKVLVVAPENDEVRSKHVQKMLEDRSEVVCMVCTYSIEL